MSRLLIVFAVLLLVSCGGGSESSNDQLGYYGGSYVLSNETEDETIFSDDGELTEDEIDCEDPIFTRTEPLPNGYRPYMSIVAEEFDDGPIECVQDGLRASLIFYGNGTYNMEILNDYQEALTLWEACRVGTQPPNFRGNWVITSDLDACIREDIIPGIIGCFNLEEDDSIIRIIQYGEEIGYLRTTSNVSCNF